MQWGPTGFNKPVPVQLEFCIQPWDCDPDVPLPRTVLTKLMYDYIRVHNLQSQNDLKIIYPDEIIKNTFNMNEGEIIEIKTFQTFMARLYTNKTNKIILFWSPKYHCLFPIEKRQYIENYGFVDIWKIMIMPIFEYKIKN